MNWSALLLAMFLLPGAAALEISGDGAHGIAPELESAKVPVTITIPCTEALSFSNPGGEVFVRTDWTVASSVILTGPSLHLISSTPCATNPTGAIEETIDFDVGITRQAPGLQEIPAQLRASIEHSEISGQLPGTELPSDTHGFTFSAAFYGESGVQVPHPLQVGQPGRELNYAFELTNFGNAKTIYSTHVVDNVADYDLIVPPPIIVDSVSTNGSNRAVGVVQIQLPSDFGWNNELATITLEIRSAAFDDPDQVGQTMTINLLARSRGYAGAGGDPVVIPGFGVVLVPMGLLAAALLARRP